MASVTEPATTKPAADPRFAADVTAQLLGGLVVALVVGGGLTAAGRSSAVALLVAVAVAQGLLAVSWILGTSLPGRNGAFVILAMAAAAADVSVSVWPHGRLGTLLAVFGLAIPVMFVHQLARSAARVRVTDSLGAIAFGVLTVVALAALVQLRHEFASPSEGGRVVAAAVGAAGAALVVGFLVDMVMPAPRFDPTVPRGLLAAVASAGVGGSIGHLALHASAGFGNGRGAFVGAALGAVTAFFAVAAAFALTSSPVPATAFARRMRVVVSVVVPIALLAPVAFLLCLAVRA